MLKNDLFQTQIISFPFSDAAGLQERQEAASQGEQAGERLETSGRLLQDRGRVPEQENPGAGPPDGLHERDHQPAER